MKYNSAILALVFLTTITACGGGSGDGKGSDKIFVDQTGTGPKLKDIPQFDIIESDVIKVSCKEDDISEDGFLTVSCLDSDGNTTIAAYVTCEAGDMDATIGGEDYFYSDTTCIKLLCSAKGNNITVKDCE